MIKEKITLDDTDNTLLISPGDEDGFHIEETEGENRVYVYYSEIEKLMQLLRKTKYEHEREYMEKHSTSSKNVKKDNAEFVNKDFGVDSFSGYYRYIKSDEWKRKSAERKNFDGKCKCCGSKLNLEVHHKHYKSLKREDVKDDLVTLCRDCHDKVTQRKKNERKGVYYG